METTNTSPNFVSEGLANPFEEIREKADRMNGYAMAILFFFGLALAGVYDTWIIAFGVGGLAAGAYFITRYALPEKKLYQYVAGVVYAVFMAQFIYQMHGMFEMHFFAFIGSGLLVGYQNWRLQVPLLATIAIHHGLFAYWQYSGQNEIFFTQLEYMPLNAFVIHVVLAAVIVGFNAWWSYQAELRTKAHSDNNEELARQVVNMKKNIAFAEEIRKGNLEVEYERLEDDQIGNSLLDMRDGLVRASKREEEEKFINVGIAQIGDLLRSNMNNLSSLAQEVISPLVQYLGANQGGMFILQNKEDDPHFELIACYAYERQKFLKKRVEMEEGLIGAVYLEKESIYMTEVPQDYVNIRSGLGGANPGCVLIVPMKSNEEIVGVLELASFTPFDEFKRNFVEKVCEDIAAMIISTRVNETTNRLLEESKRMTEEMRAQEEEMRQNMEEMQATQEEMKRAQAGLREKEANLNALINNTDDTIFAIDRNYEITVVNDTLKDKYARSNINLEVGKNISEVIPADQWSKWKERYDRCLRGEKYTTVEERDSEHGTAYMETFHSPIYDENGRVSGASVISRNITDKVTSRRAIEAKQGLLTSLINSTDDTYFAIDQEYNITMFNKALYDRMKGHDVELKVGSNIVELLPEEARDYWTSIYDRGLGGESFSFNQERKVADGSVIYLEVWVAPILDAEDKTIGASVISKDVTAWYKASSKSNGVQADPYQKK